MSNPPISRSEYEDIKNICMRESDQHWASYLEWCSFLERNNDDIIMVCSSVIDFKKEKTKEYQNYLLCLEKPSKIFLRKKIIKLPSYSSQDPSSMSTEAPQARII